MSSAATTPVVVLVVDDESLLRMQAVDFLEEAGYGALEARNGEEALTTLSQHPEVTVLFTDIHMPGRFDGLELARRVHEQWPHIRLIVTSGVGRPTRAEIPEDGTFVPKPYAGAAIARLVAALA